MGLAAALVDQARVVGRRDTGRKVEGRLQTVEYTGPWFKARLRPAASSEERSDGTVAYRRRTTLLCGLRATDGSLINIKGSDQLEVDSEALGGTSLYQVSGDPMAIRKKKALLGYRITLSKVDDERPAE